MCPFVLIRVGEKERLVELACWGIASEKILIELQAAGITMRLTKLNAVQGLE